MGGSWALLGGSWAAPGRLGRLLGGSWAALGLSWTALVRSRAALERSWAPSWSQVGPQEVQSRPQDPPKSRRRRSKIALVCKTIFRTPFWELRRSFWGHLARSWRAWELKNSEKNQWIFSIFRSFLESDFIRPRCTQETKNLHQDGAADRGPRSRGRIKEGVYKPSSCQELAR